MDGGHGARGLRVLVRVRRWVPLRAICERVDVIAADARLGRNASPQDVASSAAAPRETRRLVSSQIEIAATSANGEKSSSRVTTAAPWRSDHRDGGLLTVQSIK